MSQEFPRPCRRRSRLHELRAWTSVASVSVLALGLIAGPAQGATAGSLAQLGGAFSCVSSPAGAGCRLGRFVTEPTEVAVSPDGKFVYVVSSGNESSEPKDKNSHGTISVFSRDPLTGALSQLAGQAGLRR